MIFWWDNKITLTLISQHSLKYHYQILFMNYNIFFNFQKITNSRISIYCLIKDYLNNYHLKIFDRIAQKVFIRIQKLQTIKIISTYKLYSIECFRRLFYLLLLLFYFPLHIIINTQREFFDTVPPMVCTPQILTTLNINFVFICIQLFVPRLSFYKLGHLALLRYEHPSSPILFHPYYILVVPRQRVPRKFHLATLSYLHP